MDKDLGNAKGCVDTDAIRGGGWYGPASYCRSAFRDFSGPAGRNYGIGFRLVRTLPYRGGATRNPTLSQRMRDEPGKVRTGRDVGCGGTWAEDQGRAATVLLKVFG